MKLYRIENEESKDFRLFTETNIANQRTLIKSDIEKIRAYKTQGALIRTQSTWLEKGEKMSKYFFNLEKSRGRRKAIQRLKQGNDEEDNRILQTNEGILKEIEQYYSELFSEKQVDMQSTFLKDLEIPKVKPEDQLMLDAPILLQEIDIAVKQMAIDKCPGPDGFSHNFIVKFYPELKHLLHSVYILSDNRGELPESTMFGIVSLMDKRDRDPIKLENWRPLNMLNCTYKIYAKVIANRLQQVLPYLISPDQTGFMKGRNITTNLTELLTIIQYCEQNRIEAILTSVDYEKAFDTVNWNTMKKVMKAFHFTYRFIKLVMMCYRGFQISVANNGHQTSRISLKRGNKQGCPLSALQFLLVIEIVALKMKQNNKIKPVVVDGIRKLLSYGPSPSLTKHHFRNRREYLQHLKPSQV